MKSDDLDERVSDVHISNDALTVDLMDGRVISVPLAWYPRLLNTSSKARKHWEICGGGYGLHWPEIDEDLSTEGLLRGAPAPLVEQVTKSGRIKRGSVGSKR